ncbi:MAG: tetratricopeptide repeat protein, partial [Bryobacteraceae bacterium]
MVEAGPPSADARVVLAEFLLATRRPVEAEKELREALAIDGKHVRAMLALAALHAAGGKLEEVSRIYQQISRQGDPRYRHLYGAFLFSQGKRDEALAEFEQAARENPSDRQARSRLIAAYLVMNRSEQARRFLSAALAKNPRDIDAHLQQSEIDFRAGDVTRAQERLREVLRYKPDSVEAHFLLARTYARQGERRMEREELGQVLNLRPDHLSARLALATSFSESQNPQAALDTLDSAPPSQRESLEFIVLRSHALLMLGRIDEAAAGVTRALAMGSAPDLLVLDGEVKLRMNRYAAAQASFESALRQNPAHLGALGGLYRVVAAQKGVGSALDFLRRHAANYPKSARLQNYFGERLLANGRREDARRAFQAALEAEPGFSEAEVSLARLDLAAGNLDAARKRLIAALSKGADPVVAHSILAALETEAKNIDAAADHYRKVLEVAPANVNALTNLSYLLGEYLGREDEALNLAQKAKEMDPQDLDATSVAGWIYYRKGIYNTAAQYLKEAVSKQGRALGPTAAFRHCYL